MPESLYARNWAFIDDATQQRIDRTVLLTAGTGLGSLVVSLAARTGFSRFIVADGDVVEVSNLNRQAFSRAHLGVNKAEAAAAIVRDIRPDARIEVIPEFLTADTLGPPIAASDLVVNTIDFDDPVFLACNRIARQAHRTVLLPMNVGFGAALYVFAPDSPTIEEVYVDELARGGTDAIKRGLVLEAIGPDPHGYLQSPLAHFLEPQDETWPSDPQTGIASAIAAAMTVTAAVSLVRGEPLQTFPRPALMDAWAATRPSRRDARTP